MNGLNIPINSNIRTIQSDIDFCLRLTDVSDMKSIAELRYEMFDKFERDLDRQYLAEYNKNHSENSNVASSENRIEEYVDDYAEDPYYSEEDAQDEVVTTASDFLKTVGMAQIYEESPVQADMEYVTHGVFLEDVIAQNRVEQERLEVEHPIDIINENVQYVSHGIILEDLSNEYVSHGIILEDLTHEYVSHGVFLEDCAEVESRDISEYSCDYEDDTESQEVEEPYSEAWGYANDEEVEDEEYLESDYTYETNLEDETEESLDDSWGEEAEAWGTEEETEEPLESEEGIEEEVEEPVGYSNEEILEEGYFSSEDDMQDDLEKEEYFPEDLNQSPTNVKLEIENGVLEDEKPIFSNYQKEEQKEEIPSDLRIFLRSHPNCELSTVKKYYSSKEIDKQLKLGRVFKRNGRLSI